MKKQTVSKAAYEALQSQGMKVGSKVKIISTWPSCSPGFPDSEWTGGMTNMVGKTGTVYQVDVKEDYVIVHVDGWWYPTMVLEFLGDESCEVIVNEKVKLVDPNYEEKSFTIKMGGENMGKIYFNAVKSIAKALRPKSLKVNASYDARIEVLDATVVVGCQTLTRAEVFSVYREMAKAFKEGGAEFVVGDRVQYAREPKRSDWDGVGEVSIPFSIGDVFRVKDVSTKTGAVVLSTESGAEVASSYYFPKQCFSFA